MKYLNLWKLVFLFTTINSENLFLLIHTLILWYIHTTGKVWCQTHCSDQRENSQNFQISRRWEKQFTIPFCSLFQLKVLAPNFVNTIHTDSRLEKPLKKNIHMVFPIKPENQYLQNQGIWLVENSKNFQIKWKPH